MIDAYFTHVNPALPVIDKDDFLQSFHENTVSRLLLFAVFTAGCKVCQNPQLLDRNGTKFQSGLRYYKTTQVSRQYKLTAWATYPIV